MSKKMLGGFSQFMSAATKEAAAAEAEATAKDTILNIDVDNLVPDPNLISLYLTQYIIEDLIDHDNIQDVFGDDLAIYNAVDSVLSRIRPQ